MVVLSLVVALVAIVVAVLALRRADVVDRRVSKRLASVGDRADAPGPESQVGGPDTRPTGPESEVGHPEARPTGPESEVGHPKSRPTGTEPQTSGSEGLTPKRPGKGPADDGTTSIGSSGTSGAEGGSAAAGTSAADTAELVRRISALESRTSEGISRVAVVRYDAFEGSGGQLSYSVALVDDQGHGLVLTAIHGQAETRTYVKEIPQSEDMARPTELSPEEREVLRKATSPRPGGSSDTGRSGRRPNRKRKQ